ncbi:hypothetical protein AGR4A_pAt10504 [Agrobacterium tumefaciens str. B6]|uniref:Uncharacterized protein n=1 Tax=Agrobacterium tumefaciens str. B6 TaxID=1183423 RepID=A0A822VCB5_AGRTU|nr:hypothetical protein AGR4A_pAt10504 [Agrobacterium tumefaciens str. B6]
MIPVGAVFTAWLGRHLWKTLSADKVFKALSPPLLAPEANGVAPREPGRTRNQLAHRTKNLVS